MTFLTCGLFWVIQNGFEIFKWDGSHGRKGGGEGRKKEENIRKGASKYTVGRMSTEYI